MLVGRLVCAHVCVYVYMWPGDVHRYSYTHTHVFMKLEINTEGQFQIGILPPIHYMKMIMQETLQKEV